MSFLISKNDGKSLEQSKYYFNEKTLIFSSLEPNLVLNFAGIDNITFDVGINCNITAGSCCTFDSGPNCTFNVGKECTFNVMNDCTFLTGKECVIVRRDIFEIIKPKPNTKIKLNSYKLMGFKEV